MLSSAENGITKCAAMGKKDRGSVGHLGEGEYRGEVPYATAAAMMHQDRMRATRREMGEGPLSRPLLQLATPQMICGGSNRVGPLK